MTTLAGLRIGPLNPDGAEAFGQVNASMSARQLIRHHLRMYPAELSRALTASRNDARSGDAIDRDEADELILGELPEGAAISGLAVRGEDDSKQWLTYTWSVPDGTNRTTKGAVPYTKDLLPKSFERGDEAAQIAKAKAAGLPYIPAQVLAALGIGAAAPADVPDPEAVELRDENKSLKEELAELKARLDAVEEQRPSLAAAGGAGGGESGKELTSDAGAGANDELPEPFEGYEGTNADVVVKRVREENDVTLAEAVLAYESQHANRGTVLSAANAVIDRTPATE